MSVINKSNQTHYKVVESATYINMNEVPMKQIFVLGKSGGLFV